MQSVGTRLRAAREKRGYTLEDINSRTRINSKNLVAIETDEVRNISSPFFYRSFVRQYAEVVGLDFVSLSSAVDFLAGNMRQPDLPGQGEHQIVRVAPLQARPKRDWSWVMPAAVLVGLVVLGSAGYAFKFYNPSLWRDSIVALFVKPVEAKRETTALKVAASKRPTAVESIKGDDISALAAVSKPSLPVAAAVDKPVSDKLAAEKIHLELAATERTWLSVSADGKPAYTGILEPAETKVLEGQESARLRTGNAGGVSIIFNGKSIGAIGPRGTTRTVIFSKTGYEIEPEGTTLTEVTRIGG
jgi:cytoskeletal protein RodZ